MVYSYIPSHGYLVSSLLCSYTTLSALISTAQLLSYSTTLFCLLKGGKYPRLHLRRPQRRRTSWTSRSRTFTLERRKLGTYSLRKLWQRLVVRNLGGRELHRNGTVTCFHSHDTKAKLCLRSTSDLGHGIACMPLLCVIGHFLVYISDVAAFNL